MSSQVGLCKDCYTYEKKVHPRVTDPMRPRPTRKIGQKSGKLTYDFIPIGD